MFSCSEKDSGSIEVPGSSTGVAGSLARFAVSSDHLYTVSPTHLTSYNVLNAENPVMQKNVYLDFGVETIFPYRNNLFIGTQFGMKIMDISSPENPTLISTFQHIRSCDPVVANEKYAFVTLRDGNACTRGLNELQIVDIADLKKPALIMSYPMTQPFGLALDGNELFVCDGGIKHYDASDVMNLKLKSKTIIEANDLIAHNGILMVIGKDGIYQYDYTGGSLVFLSKISTN